jgi:hypothetical protein
MTGVGRQILHRISIRCAVEWGAALARLEQSSRRGFANEPYEATAWHDALYIVDALYHGWTIDSRFLNDGYRVFDRKVVGRKDGKSVKASA